MTRGSLWGADRAIIYLEAPKQTLEAIDGSRKDGIKSKIESFLDSPKGAFAKRVRDHVWQVKDRGRKMRAFATWCQNPDSDWEICVVLDIYKKSNENAYWEDIEQYSEAGEEYAERIGSLDPGEINSRLAGLADSPNFLVVE